MIHDAVTEMLDRKIVGLSYSQDINSRGLLKIANLEKQIHRIVDSFTLRDWKMVQTDEYFKEKDSIQGVSNAEKEYKKKLLLLEQVQRYKNV